MIPYDPKTEVCPYRTPEMREKWYQARGSADPEKLVSEPESSDPVEVKTPPMQGKESRTEKEKARLAAYRAANKERLAAKARERRAGKK
jgi:hypothetical protein